jgi:hypothetical protein
VPHEFLSEGGWTYPAEQTAAADCLQRPLLRRSRFRQRLSASVRLRKSSPPTGKSGGALLKGPKRKISVPGLRSMPTQAYMLEMIC